MKNATDQNDWKKDFGLEDQKPPYFFSSVEQLDNATTRMSHPLVIRRAFKQLGMEGVLCQEHGPVIYFRQVNKIETAVIMDLHRRFWNQGIAPLLVIISPDEIHVYSGLVPPQKTPTVNGEVPGFIQSLKRINSELRSFLIAVESGEYFQIHRRYFDPGKRVDRNLLYNLDATRQRLSTIQVADIDPQILDTILCRLVFTCYLFDRGVIDLSYLQMIGIEGATHLRDILTKQPRRVAKIDLYKLFHKLAEDFNGDLFGTNLEAESQQIKDEHLDIIDRFFHGTDISSGQQAFWPYDFGFIPIETISAIYEHFLKAGGEQKKKETGAFYTPRFLAELVLDIALEGMTSLLDKRFLDPACGSGIFLVGLFNRLAEEWKLKNPGLRYDQMARGLMNILRNNLYGIDSNRSACQITAFSLYLAFLDQLSPPDIRKLLGKWDRLPHLVSIPEITNLATEEGTIRCADFFTEAGTPPQKVNVIVGNPPWGSSKDTDIPAVRWCATRNLPHPDHQMAIAFVWKAPSHLEDGGQICLLLPHGTLFNHHKNAIHFQQVFFRNHAVNRIINLTDFRFFLFEESLAAALIVTYRKERPVDNGHLIEYWAPKTDWSVRQAELITILPQDRSTLSIREVLDDLNGDDAPLIWKTRFWATQRDRRLLDRLSLYPRLRDHTRQTKEKGSDKPWIIAQGFQPLGPGDKEEEAKFLTLPTDLYIDAEDIRFFLLPEECKKLPSTNIKVRRRSGVNTKKVFESPHVIVTRGFSRCAYADFAVTFRSSIRGIHGQQSDRELLIFLSFYLKSTLAKYFLFHTSSNWGVTRPEVHDQQLLRLPFPFPDECSKPEEAKRLVRESTKVFERAIHQISNPLSNRNDIVIEAQAAADQLVNTYFDIDEIEQAIIEDTVTVLIPSFQPSRTKLDVPTLRPSTESSRNNFLQYLCSTLNQWASDDYHVYGSVIADPSLGVGMVILEKIRRNDNPTQLMGQPNNILNTIDDLQHAAIRAHGTFDLVRGVIVFYKNLLYITKPLAQRFWTKTAALNDADKIAATILSASMRRDA
jgi:hypothetical protein